MEERRHNKKELEPFRKNLRKNLTPAEAFLWQQLRNKNFEGRKFRRQHSIDHYIVDFYCPGVSYRRTGWGGAPKCFGRGEGQKTGASFRGNRVSRAAV